MREILFRAKDESTKEWVYGFYVHLPSAAGSVHIMHVPAGNPDENNDARYIDPETLGQYTGVDDMDGVRIFEGDIVKNIVTDLICAVARDNYYAGFIINKDSKTQFSLSKASGRAHKVIGNIYDNPELVGGVAT